MAFATYHLTTGTATFGLALPQGQATNGVEVIDSSFISLNTQTDVKNTWGDGSIRFAVVSCVAPSSADYTIEQGAATSGTFAPTWPSASAAFNIGGTTWTATLPSRTTTDPWLVGPHVQEHRVKVVPLNGATPHGALEVIFDVRSYAEGGHRVDVCAQIVKDHADTNAATYDLTVTVGGSSVLTKSAHLHKTMTRWRRAFATGTPALSTVTYDMEPFHVSYTIPRYVGTIDNDVYPATDTLAHARYNIGAYGDMSEGMGSPGGRPELAYFPEWCAQWVVHQNTATYDYMIRAAELAGSWSGNLTKADGTSIKRSVDTTYWLDAQDRGGSMSIPTDPENFNTLVGIGEMVEINHIPQLCLIPYLATGDRFFIDQCRLWAHACILMEYLGDGWHTYGVDGITPMRTLLYVHQVRGIAWGLRTIAEAAAFLPDGDDDKAYFAGAVEENLTFLDWVATTLDPGGPLGIPFVSAATGGATTLAMVPWQGDYVGYGIDRAKALGFGADGAGDDMALQLATWRVRLLTDAAGWNKESGCPYWVPNPLEEDGVGTQSGTGNTPTSGDGTPTIPAGVGRAWLTMAQIYDGNLAGDGDTTTGPYGGEALVGLRIAIQLGVSGAQAAYDYLEPRAAPIHSGWQLLGVNGSETAPGPPDPVPAFTCHARWRFRA